MKFLKYQLIAAISLTSGLHSTAQVKFPVTNNTLRNNLEKVVSDFPHALSSIKGDTLEINPQSIEFASLLEFDSAPENSITQYKSIRPVHSFQAIFLRTEDFDKAVKKYKWLYNQLKVMTIKTATGYSFSLSGNYDKPEESKTFSSSVFKLTPNAADMPKLKIEAAMQFQFPAEWKVSLLVYEKEREDNERGDINGD